MTLHKELDCMQEYCYAQSDHGNISYNASKSVLHFWHYHNGECTSRKAQNFLKKLIKTNVGEQMENDNKI